MSMTLYFCQHHCVKTFFHLHLFMTGNPDQNMVAEVDSEG